MFSVFSFNPTWRFGAGLQWRWFCWHDQWAMTSEWSWRCRSLSHPYRNSRALAVPTVTVTQTHMVTHTMTHAVTHTDTLTHTVTRTVTHTHIVTHTLAHIVTHTHHVTDTLVHTVTHTHIETHTVTHTVTHTHTLWPIHWSHIVTQRGILTHTVTHNVTHTHTKTHTVHISWPYTHCDAYSYTYCDPSTHCNAHIAHIVTHIQLHKLWPRHTMWTLIAVTRYQTQPTQIITRSATSNTNPHTLSNWQTDKQSTAVKQW